MLPNWLYGKSKSKLAELLGGGGTPSDYNQVKAQVTQNTEDITLLNSAVDAKVDWDNFSEVGAVNCLENKGTTQVDAITGLTFTVNDDKSVTVSATSGTYPYKVPSAKVFIFNTDSCDNLKDGKVYRLSGCPSGGSSTSYYIAFYQSDVVDKSDQGNGYVFAKTASMTSVLTQISIKANAILSSAITFYPMITPASYNGPYVPYAKTNKELTDDVANIGATIVQKVSPDSSGTAFDISFSNASYPRALLVSNYTYGTLAYWSGTLHYIPIAKNDSMATITASNESSNGIRLTFSSGDTPILIPLNTDASIWTITKVS